MYAEHDSAGVRNENSSTQVPIFPAHNGGCSRREFFCLTGAVAAGAIWGQNGVMAAETWSPIGILLATTFTTGTLEARLDAANDVTPPHACLGSPLVVRQLFDVLSLEKSLRAAGIQLT